MIPKFKTDRRQGFTLVELLIVIAISGTLIALLIPRLRIINQERGIREAARVSGSIFATASQRAVADGTAGVVFFRNPNFTFGGLDYGCTEMGLLRAVPPYLGDQVQNNAATQANVSIGTAGIPAQPAIIVSIPKPLEQDDLQLVKVGDSVSLGTSRVKYRIFSIEEVGARLNLGCSRGENSNYLPDPAIGNHQFVIHRQPRLLRSSIQSLPKGHLVDLRFSGVETQDSTGANINVFEAAPMVDGRDFTNASIAILFNENGAIDQVAYEKQFDDGMGGDLAAGDGIFVSGQFSSLIGKPVYLFVTEAPKEVETATSVSPLSSDLALWASVSPSGSSNVGYSTPGTFRLDQLTDFYNNDRNQFNTIINACRSDANAAAKQ
jgi:prepilin-type N-terminal cleavage/methylation domain-containing protein